VATLSKTISLKTRQNFKYKFGQSQVTTPEPVAGIDTMDVSVKGSQLFYVDPSGLGLYAIDNNNAVVNVSGSVRFQHVDWASAGYGLGQDINGNLYLIDGTTITPLITPAGLTANKKLTYAITPTGQIYLTVNQALFAGSVTGNFKQIYTFPVMPVKIIPTQSNIGVVTIAKGGAANPVMTILSPSGQFIRSSSIVGSAGTWSPNGSYLAVFSDEGSGEILNSSLQKVALLPNNDSANVWLNNQTLLYGSGNTLWSYDVTNNDSVLIARLTPGNSFDQLSLDNTNHYVYLSVQNNNGAGELDRVGLLGQKFANDIYYELDIFFPTTVAGCTINYINFVSSATLLVSPNNAESSCQQYVNKTLTEDGFDINAFQVNYNDPVTP
jgi:hypothetical protein